MLIGVFVYFAATAEAMRSEYENRSRKTDGRYFAPEVVDRRTPDPNWSMAETALPSVYADWNVHSALRWISRRASGRFSIVKNGGIIGVASVSDLQNAVANGNGAWPVEKLLRVQFR